MKPNGPTGTEIAQSRTWSIFIRDTAYSIVIQWRIYKVILYWITSWEIAIGSRRVGTSIPTCAFRGCHRLTTLYLSWVGRLLQRPNFELTQLMFFMNRLKQPGGQAFLSSDPAPLGANLLNWTESQVGLSVVYISGGIVVEISKLQTSVPPPFR